MINFIKDLYVCWVLTVYRFEMSMISKISIYLAWRSTNICRRAMKLANETKNRNEEGLA